MVDLLECYAALIGSYHVSGQLVGPHFFFNVSLLKTGPTRCPQMLETNYQPMQEKIQEGEYLKLKPLLSKSLSGHKILKFILKRTLQDLPLPTKKLKIALLVTQRRVSIIQSEVKHFRLIRRYWMVQELIKIYHKNSH
jgi:hypothetical protein